MGWIQGHRGTHSVFLLLQEVNKRGIRVNLGIWNVPDWMVSNPKSSRQRRIADMDEAAESICAFLLRARDHYGVNVRWVDVNEPVVAPDGILRRRQRGAERSGAGGADQALRQAFQRTGARYPVEPKRLLGRGVHQEICEEVLDDLEACSYIDVLSVHGYGYHERENDLKVWGDWIASLDIPTWCGECDYEWRWDNPEVNTWDGARKTGILYHNVYTIGRSSGNMLWYPTRDKPSKYIMRAFFEYFTPGTTIVNADSSSSEIKVTVGKHDRENRFAMHLQNLSHKPTDVFYPVCQREIALDTQQERRLLSGFAAL